MPFDYLKDRIGELPAIYHPIPVEKPPVYNTSEMTRSVLALADYMTPVKRAQRQAAVAKANYEYRLYAGGGADKLWYWKTQKAKLDLLKTQSDINKNNAYTNKMGHSGFQDPEVARMNAAFGRTGATPNMPNVPPPPLTESSDAEPDEPTGQTEADETE